jgi:hypothetical protein
VKEADSTGDIPEIMGRREAGMGLGNVNVDLNNVRVGLNLGVNVQYAIAIDGFLQIYFTVNFMIAGTYLAFSL